MLHASDTGRCHVIELDKMRFLIYIPIRMDQIWTFNLVYIYGIWHTLTGLYTNKVFSFYALCFILYLVSDASRAELEALFYADSEIRDKDLTFLDRLKKQAPNFGN
jgi:hypothetical protein